MPNASASILDRTHPAPRVADTIESAKSKRKMPAAHLDLPVVVLRMYGYHKHFGIKGKPFTWGYAPALSKFGISQEQFISFTDELNVRKRGHKSLGHITKAGSGITAIGHFDSTGFTKLAALLVRLACQTASCSSVSGSISRKVCYLKNMNATLFIPMGLTARIVNWKELRNQLGIEPDADLLALLHQGFAVPTENDLKTGKRSTYMVSERELLALSGKVSPI